MVKNWQDIDFSQQQCTALQGLIRTVLAAPGPPAPPGLIGPHGTPAPSGNDGNSSNRWNVDEVGFFDPLRPYI